MVTFRYRTLVAFFAGVALTVIAGFALQTWRADAAPGDADSTFVPITPCRLTDTRPAPNRVGPSGSLGPDDSRTIAARGANGTCVIPDDAVGLSVNMTAVDATEPTFITVWSGGSRPLASSLNPAPGQPPTPNAVTASLSSTGSFEVYNRFGTVDLIIDVNGYHTKASLQEIAGRLAAVEQAQPFAVANSEQSNRALTAVPTAYVSLTVSAPVAGHVTLNSTAYVSHSHPGGDVSCAIYERSGIPPDTIRTNEESYQRWESIAEEDRASLSGTRRFDIAAGTTVTYSLACEDSTTYDPKPPQLNVFILSGNLTAIFTPER